MCNNVSFFGKMSWIWEEVGREGKGIRNERKGMEMVLYFQETVVLKKNREHTNLGGNGSDGDRWSS